MNQQGSGQGSIVKSDGVTLAQPGTPASIGETVVIYCTGLGAVTPEVTEGAARARTAAVLDDGQSRDSDDWRQGGTGDVQRIDARGDPGLYQINAVVPSGIVTGDAVPVVISVAGQTSPPVTMAVR